MLRNFEYLLFIFFVFGHIKTVDGQITKGNGLLGINFSGSSKSSTFKTVVGNEIDINNKRKINVLSNIRIGYFLSNKICIGINPHIGLIKTKIDGIDRVPNQNDSIIKNTFNSKERISLLSINPFLRIYVITHKDVSIFLEGSGGPTFASILKKSQINNYPKTSGKVGSENIFNFNVGIGISYYFSEKLGIELLVLNQNYKFNKLQYHPELYKRNSFLFVGLNYYL